MTTDQDEAWQAAGQRLKAIRISAGLSQEELAMDAEWDQSTLSKVERFGPHLVSFGKLKALVDVLGCTVEVIHRSIANSVPETCRLRSETVNLRRMARSAASLGKVVDVMFLKKN